MNSDVNEKDLPSVMMTGKISALHLQPTRQSIEKLQCRLDFVLLVLSSTKSAEKTHVANGPASASVWNSLLGVTLNTPLAHQQSPGHRRQWLL
jgi:hypothetical protein